MARSKKEIKEEEIKEEDQLDRAEKYFDAHYCWSETHGKYIQYKPLVEGGDIPDPNITNRVKLNKTPIPLTVEKEKKKIQKEEESKGQKKKKGPKIKESKVEEGKIEVKE